MLSSSCDKSKKQKETSLYVFDGKSKLKNYIGPNEQKRPNEWWSS